jgi:8-amino-7-oxononanoate synthase
MTPRHQLEALAKQKLFRQLQPMEGDAARIRLDHEELWNFASNDYLGLSKHPSLKRAFAEGIEIYGVGATASRLITGTAYPHHLLEQELAVAKHTEAALSFGSGYMAALAAIPVIVEKGDTVVLDRLAHASLIDAARMSGASLRVFPHNDLESLAQILTKLRAKNSSNRILVVTESIFSMDGDLCPLRELVEICEAHGAMIFLDEAHATGVLGSSGMGLAEEAGLQNRIDFQMGTLSKGLGLSGAYVAASQDWISLMVNRARPFIFTTAPPPALAHAASAALRIIRSEEGKTLRDQLFKKISLLRPKHSSAIIPIILGSNEAVLRASAHLRASGFLVPAIREPSVPRGSARLRITISASQPDEAIEALIPRIQNLETR